MAPKDHSTPPDTQPVSAQPVHGMHTAGPHEQTGRTMHDALMQTAQPAAQAAPAPNQNNSFVVPLTVVSRSDVSRSLRELNVLDDYFHQAAVRGSKDQALPTLGRVLGSLAEANQLNLLHGEDRARLKAFLTKMKANAPVVHMSFPSEASASFIAKILEWFRANVHPHVVLHVGLQPSLAAGCVVRTTNKVFDFSFRKRLEQSKQKLIAALEAAGKAVGDEMRAEEQSAEPVAAAAAPQPLQPSAVPPAPEAGGQA